MLRRKYLGGLPDRSQRRGTGRLLPIASESVAACPSTGDGKLVFQQLLGIEVRVVATERDQFLVRSRLDDAAILKHCDLVGLAHG